MYNTRIERQFHQVIMVILIQKKNLETTKSVVQIDQKIRQHAIYVHSVHAVVITTPPYPALLDTTHCTNTHAKTGMLMIKVALSVTEFQPH